MERTFFDKGVKYFKCNSKFRIKTCASYSVETLHSLHYLSQDIFGTSISQYTAQYIALLFPGEIVSTRVEKQR